MTSDTPSQAARAEAVAVDTASEMRHYMQTGEKVPAEVIGRWRALINKCEKLSASPPAEALPAGAEAVRANILKTALQRIGSASALSINAASASDALSWCRAIAREALEASLTSAPAPEDRTDG